MKRVASTVVFSGVFYTMLSWAMLPTKVMIYRAYTDHILNPNLVVTQRYTGRCLKKSIAVPERKDAWRCQASNLMLDPCFEDNDTFACIISPWSHKTAILELSQPLEDKSLAQEINTTSSQPWGLELANGQRCTFLTGASIVIAHQRVNYSCENYNYSILGNVDRSASVWWVNVYNFSHNMIDKLAITAVWF
jgi:hypothetical protein